MSDADKPTALPDMDMMLQLAEQLEAARVNDPEMHGAVTGELLRLVPGKRAIIEGEFNGKPAVFRMFLHPADDTAGREWAEMQRLWPLMNAGRYRIAQPLHLSAVNRIIVTEYLPGTPLFKHLRQNAPENPALWWTAVAKWLRQATDSTETQWPEGQSGWINRAERAASQQPFRQLKMIEAAILGEVKRIGALFQGTKWRVAICHGDYHPDNLIVNGDRLTAIDTGGSSRTPIYKDMARFLMHLGRRDVNVSGDTYLGVDRQGITSFADAFDLTQAEEQLILPFFIGCEALLRVETDALSKSRVQRAITMSEALLVDLKEVARI